MTGWEGSVAVGVNGSTGNNERFNLRGELEATRITDFTDTKSLLTYSYGKEEGETTDNRLFGSTRTDWLQDRPWRPFLQGSFDVDEFQDWDTRLTAYGGLGYEFIQNDTTELIGRVGAGGAAELGGADGDVYSVEALLGIDYTEQISDRQKLTVSAEFLPRIDGPIGPYRVNARATWQLLVDPETNLSLKAGIEDRYQSSPGAGFKRNDLDYFLLLSWSF
jgi:putative salt-induced outer membrane protein YdiY